MRQIIKSEAAAPNCPPQWLAAVWRSRHPSAWASHKHARLREYIRNTPGHSWVHLLAMVKPCKTHDPPAVPWHRWWSPSNGSPNHAPPQALRSCRRWSTHDACGIGTPITLKDWGLSNKTRPKSVGLYQVNQWGIATLRIWLWRRHSTKCCRSNNAAPQQRTKNAETVERSGTQTGQPEYVKRMSKDVQSIFWNRPRWSTWNSSDSFLLSPTAGRLQSKMLTFFQVPVKAL